MSFKLFHGTSDRIYKLILETGFLKNPNLTSDLELANYYAEVTSEEIGGYPVVLSVDVNDTSILRYDGPSMDEPIILNGDDEERRNQAWNKAAAEHPEWMDKSLGTISIPDKAWKYSMEGASSVKAEGFIPILDISLHGGSRQASFIQLYKEVFGQAQLRCQDCGHTSTNKEEFYPLEWFGKTILICEKCMSEKCFACDECHEIVCDPKSNIEQKRGDDEEEEETLSEPIHVLTQDGEKKYCEDCYNDNPVGHCLYCNIAVDMARGGGIDSAHGDILCRQCADNDGMFICVNCNQAKYSDEFFAVFQGDSYCLECRSELRDIPAVQFADADPLDPGFRLVYDEELVNSNQPCIGVELEVSIHDEDRYTDVSDFHALAEEIDDTAGVGSGEGFMLLKQDSSIDLGFEMVTVPMLLDQHKQLWEDKFFYYDYQDRLSSEQASYNDIGCHIHLNRKSLNNLGIARLTYLVYGNRNFTQYIAGRYPGGYTWKMNSSDVRHYHQMADRVHGEKFDALNFRHRNTIEFRMFGSTTDRDTLFKNMEYVTAAQEFCSNPINGVPRAEVFVQWVDQNQKKYPHLAAYVANYRQPAMAYYKALMKTVASSQPVYYLQNADGSWTCFTADGLNWWIANKDGATNPISGSIPAGQLDYRPISEMMQAA